MNVAASENRRCAYCRKPRPGRRELLTGLVVAPLYDKKIIKRSHQAITQSVKWSDVVVAVGYSFPEQDTYFFDCLYNAIKSRSENPLLVRIVSHSSDRVQRFNEDLSVR